MNVLVSIHLIVTNMGKFFGIKKCFLKEDRACYFLIFVTLNKRKEVRLCHWKE